MSARRRLALGLIAALLGVAPRATPAQPAAHLAFERLAQERGLSHGTVTAIVQDRTGFLWLGTEDGLNRYGGAGFSVFRPMQGDTTSLADGWITGLLVGRDGSLWVSTLHGGLQRFDPGTERFRHYRHADADLQSLSSDRVNAVLEAHDGAIWTGTVRGLDRLDPATGRVRRYALAADSSAFANDVLALAEDVRGRLWIGGRTGLFVFDPSRGAFEPIADAAAPWYPIRAIHADRRGTYWVATENALVAVDPTTRRVVARYGQPSAAHASPITGRVLTLGDAPDGTLWVGSDGGLASLDPATGAWHRYAYDRADPRSLGADIVRSVLVDRGGVLWAGLESYGVSKHAPSAVRFDVLRHDPGARRSLSDGYVRGITEDRAGNLWIATQFGGLNRRDARTGRITAFRHRDSDPRSLPGDNVWATYEDRAGTTWVGLYGQGLGTIDPRTGAFTRSPLVASDASVVLITEDRAGRLLVGLEGRGLVEISADRQQARSYGATRGDVRILANDDVQTVLEDRAGMLWIGGVDGLTRLDRRTGRTWRYRGIPGRPGALGTDFVTDVVQDARGTVWVATKGAGIARWDARTDRFTTFGVAEGIPHRFVYGILEDAFGRLWLSTDDGLAAFDPRAGTVTRFGLADGLQAREFNRRAFYRSPSGTMYFGGVAGVNVFRPDEAAPAPPAPPVAIVSLQPAGAAVHHLLGDTAHSTVTLAHDETAFTVTYAALDYTAPEKVRYAYRLEGVDRDWIAAGDRREASYASVRPGRYVFRVIASNAAGVWNRSGAAITVVVATPWWATWWAEALDVLGAGALVALIVHLRLLAAHRQSARLAQRVEAQTRDLVVAQTRLRTALEREREATRELFDITAAVPGAVFQLREAPDGTRTFPFVSEGVARLHVGAGAADDDPRRTAERLVASVHPDDMEAMTRVLAASRDGLTPWQGEFRCLDADGAAQWRAVQARPSREADGATVWTGVLTDATAARRAEAERVALEARMLQAQKAESLTVLAGGIAHDFNNLLVGVLANADLLRDDVPRGSDAAETVGLIRASAMRAAELTQQMLAYAGKGRLLIEHVDLVRLVPDMLALVRSAVPRTIAFDVRTEAARVLVEADATQLRQVVMNLATNAAEAIGERPGGGRVVVRVGVESAPRRELALQHASADMPEHGPYAMLEVADDGCGMEASLVDRIFDPFYSTKFTGRGLGLAALLGVVRAHHGGLRVRTAPGRGSRFVLYLPLAAVPAAPVAPPIPTPAVVPAVVPAVASVPGTRASRVLLVDDEPAVLRTAERILRAAGHEVMTATDGATAVERLTVAPDVDVVLMDMTMPHLNGLQAAMALRERGIDVPVVLMSGYSEEEIVGHGPSAIDGFLKKPFSSAEMRAAVEAVLGQTAR